jgi:hypothetical protein
LFRPRERLNLIGGGFALSHPGKKQGMEQMTTRRTAMSPLPLVGAALAAGVVLAKFLDWRGHAHPRS